MTSSDSNAISKTQQVEAQTSARPPHLAHAAHADAERVEVLGAKVHWLKLARQRLGMQHHRPAAWSGL
jgi:hypothetical protein